MKEESDLLIKMAKNSPGHTLHDFLNLKCALIDFTTPNTMLNYKLFIRTEIIYAT